MPTLDPRPPVPADVRRWVVTRLAAAGHNARDGATTTFPVAAEIQSQRIEVEALLEEAGLKAGRDYRVERRPLDEDWSLTIFGKPSVIAAAKEVQQR